MGAYKGRVNRQKRLKRAAKDAIVVAKKSSPKK